MSVLIDSSGLVKLLLEEPGRQDAVAVWEGDVVRLASRLAYPETRAALAAARRAGRLGRRRYREALAHFDARWAQIEVVELTAPVAEAAGALAERHRLRGSDSVHLASALVLGDEAVTLVTWDVALATAALDAGLPVAPAIA